VVAAQDSLDAQRDAQTASAQSGADTAAAGADHAANIAKASKDSKNAVAMQTGGMGVGLPGQGAQAAAKAPGSMGMAGKPKTIKPPAPVKGSDSPTGPTAPKAPGMKGNEGIGLQLNMAVDALMPDGQRLVGIIVGKDAKGFAMMRVNTSGEMVVLPEQLKGE